MYARCTLAHNFVCINCTNLCSGCIPMYRALPNFFAQNVAVLLSFSQLVAGNSLHRNGKKKKKLHHQQHWRKALNVTWHNCPALQILQLQGLLQVQWWRLRDRYINIDLWGRSGRNSVTSVDSERINLGVWWGARLWEQRLTLFPFCTASAAAASWFDDCNWNTNEQKPTFPEKPRYKA